MILVIRHLANISLVHDKNHADRTNANATENDVLLGNGNGGRA